MYSWSTEPSRPARAEVSRLLALVVLRSALWGALAVGLALATLAVLAPGPASELTLAARLGTLGPCLIPLLYTPLVWLPPGGGVEISAEGVRINGALRLRWKHAAGFGISPLERDEFVFVSKQGL